MSSIRKYSLFLIMIMLVICTMTSVSYAYYTISSTTSNNLVNANVTTPSCVAITLSGTSTVSLTGDQSAPVSDYRALQTTGYQYNFTVKNNCTASSTLKVVLVPTTSSTMPIGTVKYAIKESTASFGTSGSFLNATSATLSAATQSDLKIQTGTTTAYTSGYQVLSTTLAASTTKTYNLKIWIDYNEGGTQHSTIGKTFNAYLVASDSL